MARIGYIAPTGGVGFGFGACGEIGNVIGSPLGVDTINAEEMRVGVGNAGAGRDAMAALYGRK